MATSKNRGLSSILHANSLGEQELRDLSEDAVLSVEEQMRLMPERQNVRDPLHDSREDARFADVWTKGDGTVVAVRDMSQEHMCMAIGLWLRKEFEASDYDLLGPSMKSTVGVLNITAYHQPEDWLSMSKSIQTTPSLRTMLVRLADMPGAMNLLHSILQERASESMSAAQAIPEEYLFQTPAFF